MKIIIAIVAVVCLTGPFSVVVSAPGQTGGDSQNEAKHLSGISIVGNKEAPKSLFIVPWKSSEIGVETGLSSRLLNEDLTTVDKEVFERELEFYYATAKSD